MLLFVELHLYLYFILLYSILFYSTLLYSTLFYSTLLYSSLLFSTLLYYTLLYAYPTRQPISVTFTCLFLCLHHLIFDPHNPEP